MPGVRVGCLAGETSRKIEHARTFGEEGVEADGPAARARGQHTGAQGMVAAVFGEHPLGRGPERRGEVAGLRQRADLIQPPPGDAVELGHPHARRRVWRGVQGEGGREERPVTSAVFAQRPGQVLQPLLVQHDGRHGVARPAQGRAALLNAGNQLRHLQGPAREELRRAAVVRQRQLVVRLLPQARE